MKHNQFTEKVYKVVAKIPRGKVLTYKQVAKLAGRPKAYRAVGNILNKNPYPKSKVPCHRVVRSDGSIGGYNRGASVKLRLLKIEGVSVKIRNPNIEIRNKFKTQNNATASS